MADHATPNLPSRDFDASSEFFGKLGFIESYRDAGWLILERGGLKLEFFRHPELDPLTSWFSCCLRLDAVDPFYDLCKASGIPEAKTGAPRLHAPQDQAWGGRMGALIDPDGTLLRLIEVGSKG